MVTISKCICIFSHYDIYLGLIYLYTMYTSMKKNTANFTN